MTADRSSRFPSGSEVKNSTAGAADTRNMGSIAGLGSSPGEGHGNPLQFPWTEEPGGLQSIELQRVRHD